MPDPAKGLILTINAGSSSLKFALFDADIRHVLRGSIDGFKSKPHLRMTSADGNSLCERHWEGERPEFSDLFQTVMEIIESHANGRPLAAIGHRVVHGGLRHQAPALIDDIVLDELQSLVPLDPLHLPDNLAPISLVAHARPDLAQVVCFDTAFHSTMPEVARRFALPERYFEQGIRRFGFHGLSYDYISHALRSDHRDLSKGRVIVAHLGSGASLCAMRDGLSVDTSTGFSALDGLMMATRCGRIDPGVLLHLMREGETVVEIEDLLYHHAGLLGISALSDDIRVLLESNERQAKLAIELFIHRIALEFGSMASALQGIDGIVFTAGIGEHSAPVRAMICERLAWLGIRLDLRRNLENATVISADESAIKVLVIPTDEEIMIARYVGVTIQNCSENRADRV